MIREKVGNFERQITFTPGFCWLADKPNKNYGIGAVRMWFLLIGELGAVQWQIGTEWFPEAARHHLAHSSYPELKRKPEGWDLGFHSKAPMFEGHVARECDTLPEGKCYYDGSGLNADLLIEGFLNGGDDWVWNRLEAYYEHVFGDKDFPNFDPIIVPHPDERKALS